MLASDSHALLFRYNHSDGLPNSDGTASNPKNLSPVARCIVEFTTLQSLDLSNYRSLQASGVYGTLGLINLGPDTFLCVIVNAVCVATVRPGEAVQKIVSVEFYEDFLWNAYMIDSLIKFRSRLSQEEKTMLDTARMLTCAVRGFVMTVTIPAAASPIQGLRSNYPSTLTIVSRLSCRRAGTRFNSRGVDDDGYAANFVASETVLWHPSGLCFSYAQVRGSVPIFWEQATGLLPNQHKIQITRSPEATQPAFDKHFEQLELRYGTVHILNLMSASRVGEVELTERYSYHTQKSPLNRAIGNEAPSGHRLIQSHFDFHAETKGPGGYEAASMVRRLVQDRAESFGYFLCNTTDLPRGGSDRSEKLDMVHSTVILQQQGVFRVNCLDCLDRTNLIQTILSQMAIEMFLSHRSERATADFWMRHSSIWADNGDVSMELPQSMTLSHM
ncbi:MAG: hypothetical protein Q9204_002913 [Flavoplaca sp. TL-2023a]